MHKRPSEEAGFVFSAATIPAKPRDRFTADDPRACGRADVGLRCVSAALFRSQGLRPQHAGTDVPGQAASMLGINVGRFACPSKPATTPSKFRARWPEAERRFERVGLGVYGLCGTLGGLVPDEPRLASRVFEAFESFFAGRGLPDPDEDPEARNRRGHLECNAVNAVHCLWKHLARLGVHRT